MTINLVKTCNRFPEQYDAFMGQKQVGYLRLRHGEFTVEYPDAAGELLLTEHPKGDGEFDDSERERFLELAKAAIETRLK